MTLTTLTLFCLLVVVALIIYVIKYEKKIFEKPAMVTEPEVEFNTNQKETTNKSKSKKSKKKSQNVEMYSLFDNLP